MLVIAVHYASAALAIGGAIAFVLFGLMASQFLDPDRPLGDKLTTALTPSRRASDFVGPGWRYQKLQWLSAIGVVVGLLFFGITS